MTTTRPPRRTTRTTAIATRIGGRCAVRFRRPPKPLPEPDMPLPPLIRSPPARRPRSAPRVRSRRRSDRRAAATAGREAGAGRRARADTRRRSPRSRCPSRKKRKRKRKRKRKTSRRSPRREERQGRAREERQGAREEKTSRPHPRRSRPRRRSESAPRGYEMPLILRNSGSTTNAYIAAMPPTIARSRPDIFTTKSGLWCLTAEHHAPMNARNNHSTG